MSKGTRMTSAVSLLGIPVLLLLAIACEDTAIYAPADGSMTILASPAEVTVTLVGPTSEARTEIKALLLNNDGVPTEGASVIFTTSDSATHFVVPGTDTPLTAAETDGNGIAHATLVVNVGPPGDIDVTGTSGAVTATGTVRREVDCQDGNVAPTAVLAAVPPANNLTSTDFPRSVVLNGSQSSDPTDDPLTFAWDCGGGTEVPGTGPTTTCRYAVPGTYTVTLTVGDDGQGVSACAKSSDDTTQVVLACGNHAPVAQVTPPTINNPVTFPFSVQISGSATDQDAGDTFTYSWNCGSGGTATSGGTSTQVTCSYASAGTREVTFTVSDSVGTPCKGSDTDTVQITLQGAR